MPIDIIHTDISEVSKSLSVLGGFIVIYGLVSFVLKERLYLSEPLLAVTLGIIVGPYVLNWVDPRSWGTEAATNDLTYQFPRIVVGIQVLFTGISLPKAYLWKERVSLTILLFAIMTTAWFTTALLIWGLIPNMTFLESLCISAAVTPTDPVLANSITTGRFAEKHVPANVRNIIIAESGANDGLGFPFLFLAIYLLSRTGEDAGSSVGTEVGRWVYAVVIYQVLLSVGYGTLVGFIARKTLRWAEARSYIDKANFFAYGLGLAFFTLGTTGLFGSDDILACFIAGNSFTWDDWFRLRTEDHDFQEILDMVLNMTVFVYIGTIIPWVDYSNPDLDLTGWRVVVLSICILLLRRPPWVIAATKVIPALRDWKESAFAGWFGPIGVSAVFYIEVALRELPDDGTRDRLRRLYTPIVLFCVFASVLTHGITIPVSKLGPGVMKRTVTLTQTRSLTFSRPLSRVNTVTIGEVVEVPTDGRVPVREPWNPFYSIARWLRHVFLFWEKDSFWRKEVVPISKDQISAPQNTHRRSEVHSGSQTGEGSTAVNGSAGDGSEIDSARNRKHLPPPALELPLTRTTSAPTPISTTQRTENVARSVSRPPPATGSTSRESQHQHGVGGSLLKAFERQLSAERAEAQSEALHGWERGREREERRIRQLESRRLESQEQEQLEQREEEPLQRQEEERLGGQEQEDVKPDRTLRFEGDEHR